MAAEIETHRSFCSNDNNICSSYNHLAEELSAILNHGSISLGRYAGNSSAWEKRSVFGHNRCQDELNKFKAPGLVAQKKAYFEQYYKFVGSMKALPAAHQRETTLLRNGIDAAVAKKEEKLSNASQIQTKIHLNSNNSKQCCKKVESCSRGSNDNEAMRLVGNSKRDEQKTIASSKVLQSINNLRKYGTALKNKGTLASAIDKVKACSKITRDAGLKSKLKPSFLQQAPVKVNKTIPPRKESTSNTARKFNRQITEPHSSFPRKAEVIKPSSNSQHSRTKLETKLLIKVPNVQVTKLTTSSASRCCIRKTGTRSNSNSQHSRNKTEKKLPVLSRISKMTCISKTVARSNCLRNMAHDRRKSSEQSSHHIRPEVEESADQRPKVIFRSLLAREISNHNIGVEQIRSCNKELKKKEGGQDKIHAGLRRGAKHASTLLSCTNKASVQKLARKIVPLESAKLKCDRAEQRQKRPIWR